MTKILSVGGSIIAPDKPDSTFLSEFVTMCKKWLDADKQKRLILSHLLSSHHESGLAALLLSHS